MRISRRKLVLGAAAAGLALPAHAQSKALTSHVGYKAWSPPAKRDAKMPLAAMLDTGGKAMSLGDFMEGRPAVLSAWATWCGPCLAEKGAQASMSARLVDAKARLRFLAIQAFDDVSLQDARRRLKSLGAEAMTNAQAGPDLEDSWIAVFGRSLVDPSRTSMPALILADADGTILGQTIGMMFNPEETTSYWEDDRTFDFLSTL